MQCRKSAYLDLLEQHRQPLAYNFGVSHMHGMCCVALIKLVAETTISRIRSRAWKVNVKIRLLLWLCSHGTDADFCRFRLIVGVRPASTVDNVDDNNDKRTMWDTAFVTPSQQHQQHQQIGHRIIKIYIGWHRAAPPDWKRPNWKRANNHRFHRRPGRNIQSQPYRFRCKSNYFMHI